MGQRVFGIGTEQVLAAAQTLKRDAQSLTRAQSSIRGGAPEPASLPGGRAAAAAIDGAGRVGEAVGGEAAIVDVAGTDLRSFVKAVDDTELTSASVFSAGGC
ncbi:MAG: hypothetical protein ACTH1D_05400 [Mycobacteriaceae bacterium]|uniref:hypothetical protein n=1 Tax=Corynebacterium sp. TaxID=1720 RepID=UPI003F9C00F1